MAESDEPWGDGGDGGPGDLATNQMRAECQWSQVEFENVFSPPFLSLLCPSILTSPDKS